MGLLWLALAVQLLLLDCSDDPSHPCDATREHREAPQSLEEESTSWKAWLLDPARVVIFLLSLLLITYASQQAVKLDREPPDDRKTEVVHDLMWYHVILFPLVGSVMLLVIFYFFEYIQFIYMILSAVISVLAMYNLLLPVVQRLVAHSRERFDVAALSPSFARSVTVAGSVVIAVSWVLTGHWICLDVLGVALCVLMIQFIRVPSLKISSMLLLGLLFYDVFWVFYSTSIFKANVMVEVATKKAINPIAMVAHRLNFPNVAKSSPPLSIPGKLLIPSILDGQSFVMLGLGDIVLPGLLLCFAMRFDNLCPASNGGTSRGGSVLQDKRLARLLLFCQRWSYFSTALLGYAAGLLMASVVADITRSPQPALLYLVPCVLSPMLAKAALQGDFKSMWHGPFTTAHSQKAADKYSLLPV